LVMAVDPTALAAHVREARPLGLAVAAALLPINLALDGWVWGRYVRPVTGPLPRGALSRAVLAGFALRFWTPAELGEYAGRVCALPYGNRFTLTLTVLAQRLLDMAVAVGIGTVGLAGAIAAGWMPATAPWWGLLGIGGVVTIGLVGILTVPRPICRTLYRWVSSLAVPEPAGRGVALLRRFPGGRADALAGSLVRYGVFVGQFVALGWAVVPSASLLPLTGAAVLTFYAKFLLPSLTLLDLGVREGAAALFFGLLVLAPAAGLQAALGLFVLNLLVPAVLGVPFVPTLSLRRPAAQAPSA